MKRIFPFGGYTWKGQIFGIVLFGLCLGIFLAALTIILKHFLFPELSSTMIAVINGGVAGILGVLSFTIAKWYWNWADRVMAKFFGSNSDKQEGWKGLVFGTVLLGLCFGIFVVPPLLFLIHFLFS